MRFEFAVVAVVAAGFAVGAALGGLPPPGSPTSGSPPEAKPAAPDPSSFHFTLADLNPLRLIFDYEQHVISTDANRNLFPTTAPILKPDFSWAERAQSQYNRDFDPDTLARMNAEGLQTQMRERSLHQQDIMNYVQSGGRGPSPIFP